MTPHEADILAWTPRGFALRQAQGRAYKWHNPGWPEPADFVHTFAKCAIRSIGAQTGDTIDMLKVSLSVLTSAVLLPGCAALEIRYLVQPANWGGLSVTMWLTAKCYGIGDTAEATAVEALRAAVRRLPRLFSAGRPVATDSPTHGQPVVELRRNEVVVAPSWEYIPADFFYAVEGCMGDGSGWRAFWEGLNTVGSPVEISLLFQNTEVHPDEEAVIGLLLSELYRYAESRYEPDLLGNQVMYPADENARWIHELWAERRKALRRPVLGRFAIRGALEAAVPVAGMLAAAMSERSDGRGAATPMRIDAAMDSSTAAIAAEAFDLLEVAPWGGPPLWSHPNAPHVLRRLPYLYGLAEAAGALVLPVPGETGVPGFNLLHRVEARTPRNQGNSATGGGITLGRIPDARGPDVVASIERDDLTRHLLLVGTPGSGKTTTALSILAQLWIRHRIPFLVIEPTKTEYRNLLLVPGMEDLRVFTLGRDDVSPFRMNPMEPPPGVQAENHVNSLMAALKAALPLAPPLPQLLDDAIHVAFYDKGWKDTTTSADGLRPPTLRDLVDAFDRVFAEAGYVGEAANIGAAMTVRLRSLMRGSKGRVLHSLESIDFERLLSVPVLFELDEIGDPDDKAVFAMLLLDRLRASARMRGNSGGHLRHVTVLEEAHRLLGGAPTIGYGPEAPKDPKTEATSAFVHAIAELRSVGEGFVVVSQSPSQLAQAAIANTSSRIIHRLENSLDRQAMLDDMDVDEEDRARAARLRVGEAVARWPTVEEAEFIRVEVFPGIDTGRNVTTDEVARHMRLREPETIHLLPYALCTREVCTEGCDPRVRASGEAISMAVENEARMVWRQKKPEDAHSTISTLLLDAARQIPRHAYCGAAHLEAKGHAFNVSTVDIRGMVYQKLFEAP